MDELKKLKDINRDLRRSFDQLSALQSMTISISESKTLNDIVSSLIQVIPQIIECHSCRIYLFDNEKFNKVGEAIYKESIPVKAIDEEVMYWCCKRGTVTVQPGLEDKTGHAIAPLTHTADIIGVIVLDLGEYIDYYSEVTGLALTTIANHTALAISNYRFHTQMEEKAGKLNDMKKYVDGVIASIAHSVITVDHDGKITVFNRKAEDFFQIRSKIAVGNSYSVVLPEYLRNIFSELLLNIQSGKDPAPVELAFSTIYNEERNTLITASPLKVTGTHKPGMVCICQDLALSKEVERLKELDQMKDDFISMVSHELKTPLASILAYSESLLDGLAENKEEEKEYLKVIYDEGNRLGQLVNDILDLSKIESGKMDFHMASFAPADLIKKGISSVKTLCKKKKQNLIVQVDEGLPAVHGDFEKITQVLINMLSNAVKFTNEGGDITVGSLGLGGGETYEENAVSTVLFFVEDTGIGIKKEDFKKVFDKFTHIEPVMHHVEGTGLGMPISREIMRKHGSDLEFTSHPGRGSRFEFKLKST
ncbi:histidine kinase dimerization/phospho-acceptor domain-containing protein [Fibrobacterota bacterium]